MGLLILLLAIFSPRLAIVVLWLFTNVVDRAFTGAFAPLLGLVFLPWTTLTFVLVHGPLGGISFFEWILVAIGFVIDLGSYATAAKQRPPSSASQPVQG